MKSPKYAFNTTELAQCQMGARMSILLCKAEVFVTLFHFLNMGVKTLYKEQSNVHMSVQLFLILHTFHTH